MQKYPEKIGGSPLAGAFSKRRQALVKLRAEFMAKHRNGKGLRYH